MTKKNNLKEELEKRNILVKDLRIMEAYGLAREFKEHWDIDNIIYSILNPNINCFQLEDSEFLKAIETKWNIAIDDGTIDDNVFPEYLDNLQEIGEFILQIGKNGNLVYKPKTPIELIKSRIWTKEKNEIPLKEFKEKYKEKWSGIILKEVCDKCNSENIIIIKEKLIQSHGEIFYSSLYPLTKCLNCGYEAGHVHYCMICLEVGEDASVCLKCSGKYTTEEIKELISIPNLEKIDLGQDIELVDEKSEFKNEEEDKDLW